MSAFVKVGTTKDFPNNEATAVNVNGRALCIAHYGAKFYALDNRCTHAESQLSGGEIEDGELACPLHGARFSLETGDALTLPAVKPVKRHDVKVEGDDVLVSVSP